MDDTESNIPPKQTEIAPETSDDDAEDEEIEAEIEAIVFDSSAIAATAELIKACGEVLRPNEQAEVYKESWPDDEFRRITMRIYRQIPGSIKKIYKALGDN